MDYLTKKKLYRWIQCNLDNSHQVKASKSVVCQTVSSTLENNDGRSEEVDDGFDNRPEHQLI